MKAASATAMRKTWSGARALALKTTTGTEGLVDKSNFRMRMGRQLKPEVRLFQAGSLLEV